MKLIGALALGLLTLAGCSGRGGGGSGDPYAGLSEAILSWKSGLAANDISCRRAPAGQKCSMFEVSCKGQRPITPKEQAAGVTAKLVADLTWSGFDDKGRDQTASAVAQFSRARGAWTRGPARPVNPESCADL
ncbi:MAG TPA: hypothetical protein VHV27_00855 [Phenylobacterium sp.]|jgi:hypothetical protein|nr:hypothetical protein [Phenylobacterium sp.]